MFSGIIDCIGVVEEKKLHNLSIYTPVSFSSKLHSGDSIGINGACLTLIEKPKQNIFTVEIMEETAKKTTLGSMQVGSKVNLELPLTILDFISGHLVQGHVDTTAKIANIKKLSHSHVFEINFNKRYIPYLAPKGSIAINGVSLTIIDVKKNRVAVGIIPYTWKRTTFQYLKTGDLVNIEIDMIAKYVRNQLKPYEKK